MQSNIIMFPSASKPKFEKNNLPIGTIVKLIGYNFDHFAVVERQNESLYKLVNIDNPQFRNVENYTLRHISEQFGIGYYFTDDILTKAELNSYVKQAREFEDNERRKRENAAAEKERLKKIGLELAEKYLKGHEYFIVAEKRHDNSDIMSDYYGSTTGEIIILGISKTKRDNFREMRKFAALIPETRHLAEANSKYEHREKYSMGNGYYLKENYYHNTGWLIYKSKYYKWNCEEFLISLAKKCIFEDTSMV